MIHARWDKIDAVLKMEKAVYLFKFKLNGSEPGALAQMQPRGYVKKFGLADKQLCLVRATFYAPRANCGLGSHLWVIE